MAESVISKDIVKSIDAIDLIGGSITKPLVEGILSPVVGNGNFVSGVVKMGAAVAAAKYGGKGRVPKSIAIGAGMDGAEDLIIAIKGKIGGEAISPTGSGVF